MEFLLKKFERGKCIIMYNQSCLRRFLWQWCERCTRRQGKINCSKIILIVQTRANKGLDYESNHVKGDMRTISKEIPAGYNNLLGMSDGAMKTSEMSEIEIWQYRIAMPLNEVGNSRRGTSLTAQMINLVYKC
jgi:hypothetical protein